MQDRYSDQFQNDATLVTQGDEEIVGMDARTQPERLEPGYAQYLQNMRLDTLTATVRKGMAKQTNSISFSVAPLIIPFTLGPGAVLTALVTDGIFASCEFSDPNNNNALYIFLATGTKVYTFASATQAVTSIAYPANELVETSDSSTSLVQMGGSVYLFRGLIGISFTVSSLTSAATTATLTTVGNHGLSTNMYVRVAGATQAPYNGDFQITVTGATTFTYVLPSTTTTPATGTITLNRLKTPLVWAGNFSSPFTLTPYGVISQNFYYPAPSNFAYLQQNRLILQYSRNQLIYSQVLNAQSYDIINGVFSFNPGSNDYLVGIAPYQDVQTLVFMRQSVWLVNGVNGDVAAMTTQLVTNQVGCCSRNSISTCGPDVLFLNERGVFKLQPGYELTLRGNALPLSAPVDSFIQTINYAALNKAYSAYHLNRYYLAIPVNGSTRNNAMLVYNFINEAWESYDTFPNGFYCDELQEMLNPNGVPTLYAISYEGGIYAYEQNEQDDFAAAANPPTQYLIQGQFLTRRFNFGTGALKRFNRVTTVLALDNNSSFSAQAQTINPEDTKTLPSVAMTTAGQITRPSIINKRAYAIQVFYQNTALRGSILNYQIGAYVQDQKSTKTT